MDPLQINFCGALPFQLQVDVVGSDFEILARETTVGVVIYVIIGQKLIGNRDKSSLSSTRLRPLVFTCSIHAKVPSNFCSN